MARLISASALDKCELIGGRHPVFLEEPLEAFSRPHAGRIAHEDQCRGDQAPPVPGRFPFGKRKAEALEKRDDELWRKRFVDEAPSSRTTAVPEELRASSFSRTSSWSFFRSDRSLQTVRDNRIAGGASEHFAARLAIRFIERKMKRNALHPDIPIVSRSFRLGICRERDGDLRLRQPEGKVRFPGQKRTGAGGNPLEQQLSKETLSRGGLSEARRKVGHLRNYE